MYRLRRIGSYILLSIITFALFHCTFKNSILLKRMSVLKAFKLELEATLPPLEKSPLLIEKTKRLANLKPFDKVMTDEEKRKFLKLIKVFDKTMSECETKYMMSGGTLLGSYRHHGFIPWDDDFDVIVDFQDKRKMARCFRKLQPKYVLAIGGHRFKFHGSDGLKLNRYHWLWPYVDVTFYDQKGSFLTEKGVTYGKYTHYPVAGVFPLRKRIFEGMWLMAPKDAYLCLIWSYGFTDKCKTLVYSHQLEKGLYKKQIHKKPCSKLAHRYGFVKKSWSVKTNMKEEMILNDTIVHTIYTYEPKYASGMMFGLSLDPAKIPSDLPVPTAASPRKTLTTMKKKKKKKKRKKNKVKVATTIGTIVASTTTTTTTTTTTILPPVTTTRAATKKKSAPKTTTDDYDDYDSTIFVTVVVK